jgi:4-hydroxy-3-polyprenylbenzoate decarboxylase
VEIVVAVTGASGAIYARRFLELTPGRIEKVHLVVSERGRQVAAQELSPAGATQAGSAPARAPSDDIKSLLCAQAQHVVLYDDNDLTAPPASGLSAWQAMVVVPCSMGTLGRIAAGAADTLITRAADVALKERRRLVLVCRETPLSLIHLRNMTAVTEAGGVILPAAPGWYHRPRQLGDLVDFVVQRIYQALGPGIDLVPEWGAPPPQAE